MGADQRLGWRRALSASIVILAALLLEPSASPPGAPGGGAPTLYAPHVPGEILIKFRPDARAVDRANARALVAGSRIKKFRIGAEHWKVGRGLTAEKAIRRLQRHPRVAYAEPNYIVHADVVPDDPRYGSLWALRNIDAEPAWDISTGSRQILVGVIDTGIDYLHPDLAANIWANPGEIAANGIDDDGNGFIDDVHGWDFVNDDGDPMDDHGHGTHVAGTIGAVGNNGVGVAGVNWEVSLAALKFIDAGGYGATSDAIAAVEYATLIGARITNNSWGGVAFSRALLDAIYAAGAAGGLFVASAGNDGSNNDLYPHYPSSYDAANIISVAATDYKDAKAGFSNYGATTVDLGAPGVNILSTIPNRLYGSWDGTSMAAPHVSGVAALALSVVPDLPVGALKSLILEQAEPIPSMAGITVTGGRLNALGSVGTLETTPPDAIGDLVAHSPASNSVSLSWTASGDDGAVGTATAYDVRHSTTPLDEASFASAPAAAGPPPPAPAGSQETMEVTGLDPETTYHFAVKAVDEWGNTGPISNVVSETTLPPPTFASSPPSFTASLLTGQSTTRSLLLENVGVGTLDWRIPDPAVSGSSAPSQQELLPLEKGEADPRAGPPAPPGFGGPDAFGHRFVDSDQPGGPLFEWRDISLSGSPIRSLDGDDQISEPIPIGFGFPFYGEEYDAVRVSTDGWLSFTSASPYPVHQPIPCPGTPANLIAPFWTDLDFQGSSRAVYARDRETFTVQFTDVPRHGGPGRYTFQAILRETGEIRLSYLSMSGDVSDATVGIQNEAATDGLQVAFNSPYLHDALTVRIDAVPRWLTAAPAQGRLLGGETATVTITIDASYLPGGRHLGTLNVETNDPNSPVVGHSVTLDVTDAPAVAISPDLFEFGDVTVGLTSILPLTIQNTGTVDLTVSSITAGDPSVAVSPAALIVPPGWTFDASVSFSPAAPGVVDTTLTVESDASNEPAISLPVSGTGLPPPGIQVDPTSLSETLSTGQTTSRSLRITNTGASDLSVTLSAELMPGASGAAPSWVERAKGDETENGAGSSSTPERHALPSSGYVFRDSDMPGGPGFHWEEIASAGSVIPVEGDDETSGPIPIGFQFPFYDESHDTVRISSNGWLSFTNGGTAYSNPDALPNAGPSVPENLIAPFFDDMDFQGSARATYLSDGSRFVVQYTGSPRATPGSDLTFQAILHQDGRIVFQYGSMSGVLDSATIGIQNGDRTEGLLVSYNQPYVHDGLAIELIPPPTMVNGGFELGDFSGWTAASNGLPGLTPWTVGGAGLGYFGNSSPREGAFDALNGFDGEAGLEYTLHREISLPLGMLSAQLTYYDRIQFDSLGVPSTQPRLYEATIRDLTGIPLALVAREEILLSGRPYTDLGWQRRSVDLTPFAGQTVRLQITEFIPESSTGPAQIEFDDFRIQSRMIPEWLAVAPASRTIPPGGSEEFLVTFDAGGSGTAQYHGAIRIETNIPAAPTLRVPAVLSVMGAPAIVVSGREMTHQSTRPYAVWGARTDHSFSLVLPPAGGGSIELVAQGNYRLSYEYASVVAEGIVLGRVGGVGTDCAPASGLFPLSARELATLAADGVVEITVQNSTSVGAFCARNSHTVRLSYRETGLLDFGTVYTNTSLDLPVGVENRGTDPLVVTAVSSDLPEYSASPISFSVDPGALQLLTIRFAPGSPGSFDGTFFIHSNDPDTPVVTISVSGIGQEPPVVGVQPTALSSTLLVGERETQTLTLSNSGGSDLDFSLVAKRVPLGPPAPGGDSFCTPTSAIVSEFYGGRLSEVDLVTGRVNPVARGLDCPNKGLALDAAATTAFVTEYCAGTVAAVDLATGTVTRVASDLAYPNGLALSWDDITAYVTQTSLNELSAIDLTSGVVRFIASGLDTPNGVALNAAETTALVVEYLDGELSAVDLASGAVTLVAGGFDGPVSVAFDPHEATAYVVERNDRELSAVDLATGAVSLVAMLPGRPGSLAVDPDGTTAYVTEYDTGSLSKVDLASGAVTWIASGMDTPLAIALVLPPGCRGRFLRLDPISGTVPPQGSLDVSALFDATVLYGGPYAAEIEIRTNDPVTPLLAVPASLTAIGVPDIELKPEMIRIESTQDYFTPEAATAHDLPIAVPPPGDGVMELLVEGDFGSTHELATLSVEGIVLGSVGGLGADCMPGSRFFPLSAADLALFAADGIVEASVQNSPTVDFCLGPDRHTVRLLYEVPVDTLDFGQAFLGCSAALPLRIDNRGTDFLEVTSIASNLPEYTTAPAAFTLAPGSSQTVTVTFTPSSVGAFAATLGITSNDPDEPVVSMALAGTGLEPPVLEVDPESLASTLLSNRQETQTLTISNWGGSRLDFTLRELASGTQPTTSLFAGLSPELPGLRNNAPGPEVPSPDEPPGLDPALEEEEPGQRGEPVSAPVAVNGVPGDFEALSDSPVPLTCIAGDPSNGILYGQADRGTAFYRYLAWLDRWEQLSDAPVTALNNGGAALLNGKIYTTYAYSSGSSVMGIYEIASDSWATIPHPLAAGTGNIASDGVRYLYLVVDRSLVRFDPTTTTTTLLASPPFDFEPWGGLRHLDGILYGHQGNGLTWFASYDIAQDRWSLLPPLPGGAYLGAAIDPGRRSYIAYGTVWNLYQYSIDQGSWTVATIPFFSVDDGGLALLPSPVAGIYFIEGEGGTGLARLITVPSILTLNPSSGSVPPGGSVNVDVTFNAGGLFGGTYASEIAISSNDPATPQVRISAALTVIDAPDLEIGGPTVSLDSMKDYYSYGALTSHSLAITAPPTGDGSLRVIADGDYGDYGEFAIITAEGLAIGTVGESGVDCSPAVGAFGLSASDLSLLAADGVVHVEIENTASVDAGCPLNRHTVELRYLLAADALDFGTVYLGAGRDLSLVIRNAGTDTLEITSIASTLPEYVPSLSALTLPPSSSETLVVSFSPSSAASFFGTLTIVSNDPDTPSVSLGLSGTGLVPPLVNVQPLSLSATLFAEGVETQSLTISNTGGGDLDYDISVAVGAPPLFLAASPSSATVPAGGSADVDVIFNAAGLDPGNYAAEIEISSNDPITRVVLVHAYLTVLSAPDIAVSRRTEFESSQDYFQSGALTSHSFAVGPPPVLGGAINLLAEGDYGVSTETATVIAEGQVLGSVGGVGTDCTPAEETFPLSTHHLAALAADGVVNVDVQNAAAVDAFCSPNRHTVRLVCDYPADPLDFGTIFGGSSKTLPIRVGNPGAELLDVASIASDIQEFSVSPTALTLAPGSFETVSATFLPLSGGTFNGTLTFASNDPDEPLVTIALAGTALEPPVVGVDPPALASELFEGHSETQTLTILNTGGNDLVFSLSVQSDVLPPFMTLSPTSGTVPADGALEIAVTFDAGTLPIGTYPASVILASNDPLTPELSVLATLFVRGIPAIRLNVEPVTVLLESTVDFTATGAVTNHRLGPAPPPSGAGVFELVADGEFNEEAKTATARAEGFFAGTVGGTGPGGCATVWKNSNMSESLLAFLLADGVLDVQVTNSLLVQAICPVNQHTVRLRYQGGSGDHLDFGDVIVGASGVRTLRVESIGTGDLEITSITADRPGFSASPSVFTLPPGGSQVVTVSFAPSAVGDLTGTLTVASNSLENPTITLALSGAGIPPPVAGVDPGSFEMALPPGGSTTRTLRLSNSGGTALNWSIQESGSSATGTPDPEAGRAGGPDGAGYTYRDSDAPDGPEFDWEEISDIGTPVPISGDDENSGPIPLGFSFPFYGVPFDTVNVSTNGWMSFTNTGAAYRPSGSLPDAGASVPENLIAPFFDDLDLEGIEKVAYHHDGTRFIVQFTGVDRIQRDSDLTFQVILHPSGRILFQYLSMSGRLSEATIGIQNGERTDGLLVSGAGDPVRDRLAVEILPPVPAWIDVAPSFGAVPPGNHVDIAVAADASGLANGDHHAVLSILSNDPVNSRIDLPVLLHVGEVELDYILMEPATLNLGSHGRTVRGAFQLPAPYDPHDVVVSTVSLNGQLYANPGPVSFTDDSGDGIEEIVLKFDRAAFEALLPEGDSLPVTATGEVRDTIWFTGTAFIRAIRPQLTHPNGGEYLFAGDQALIAWNPPDWQGSIGYDLILSRDGGESWELLASGLAGTSFVWAVNAPYTARALVRVLASDGRGVIGYDTGDGEFVISDRLRPPHAAWNLTATTDTSDLVLTWSRPAVDLAHGPASSYRILEAGSPFGPFTEIGTAATESFRAPLASQPETPRFLKVVASNAAGDAAD